MKMRILALMALVAVATMAGGCAVNATDRAQYDSYYTTVTDTGKVVFDVPYKTFMAKGHICDSGTIVEALKTTFGNQVAFQHSPDARVVDWKSMNTDIGWGFIHHCVTTDVVDYTANGKTQEITGVAHWTVPWSYSPAFVRKFCLDASQDIARQIKVLVDSESK